MSNTSEKQILRFEKINLSLCLSPSLPEGADSETSTRGRRERSGSPAELDTPSHKLYLPAEGRQVNGLTPGL